MVDDHVDYTFDMHDDEGNFKDTAVAKSIQKHTEDIQEDSSHVCVSNGMAFSSCLWPSQVSVCPTC